LAILGHPLAKISLAGNNQQAMASVLQLTRPLAQRPPRLEITGVQLRNYAGPADIPVWLSIRDGAFARQKVGVRQWNENDFQAEFLDKRWWNPRSIWFAEIAEPPVPRAVGTIALTWRGTAADAKPAIHWLAVLRSHRRRGIGRLLLNALETECWDQGYRQVWLETHVDWSEAGEFYTALGYLPATQA